RDWITQRAHERRAATSRRQANELAEGLEDFDDVTPDAPETPGRRVWSPIWKSENKPAQVVTVSADNDFPVDSSAVLTAPGGGSAQGQPALETASPFSKNSPEISPIRKQAAEALRAYAAKTDQLKTGRSGDPGVARDPDVAEMTSTLWIDRSSG